MSTGSIFLIVAAVASLTFSRAAMAEADKVQFSLLREYKGNHLFDVSLDGESMLLWQYRVPVLTFRPPYIGEANRSTGTSYLRVVDRVSGIERSRVAIPDIPFGAKLAYDSNKALFTTLTEKRLEKWVWNPEQHSLETWCPERFSSASHVSHNWLNTSEILLSRDSELLRVRSTDCKVLVTRPVGSNGAKVVAGPVVSPDKKLFAYVMFAERKRDQACIAGAEDLQCLNVIRAPSGYIFWQALQFASDSRFLIAQIVQRGSVDKYALAQYDTRTGALTRAIDVDARSAFAISPDARFLAVGHKRVLSEARHSVQAEVVLYSFVTGERLGSAQFPRVTEPRDNPWIAEISRLAFSSDSTRLIAGTDDVREWQLQDPTR